MEKVDAGQRRYCEVSLGAPSDTRGERGGADSSLGDVPFVNSQDTASALDLGVPDAGSSSAIDTRILVPNGDANQPGDSISGPSLDLGTDVPVDAIPFPQDTGTISSPDASLAPDARDALGRDAWDAPAADLAPDTSPDAGTDGLGTGDASPTDGAMDSPSDVTLDAPITDLAGPPLDSLPGDTGSVASLCSPAQASEKWPLSPGGVGLTFDKNGSLFFAGTYGSSMTLPGLPSALPNAGLNDIVIAKVNPQTGSAIWAKGFGDPGDQIATKVAVNATGVLAFAGILQGEVILKDPDVLVSSSTPVEYIGALASEDGVGRWIKLLKVGDQGALMGIAGNPNLDYFVLCGYATAATSKSPAGSFILPGIITAPPAGGRDLFLAAIKGDGTVLWAKAFGGAGDQECRTIALSDQGEVVITGLYRGSLSFGGTSSALATLPTEATMKKQLFAARISGTTGEGIVSKTWTSITEQQVTAIATDSAGNIYIGGALSTGKTEAIAFGPGIALSSQGLADAFVVKFNSALTALWAHSYGDATYNQYLDRLVLDTHGNLIGMGRFIGAMQIGAVRLQSFGTSGGDLFLTRWNSETGESQCTSAYHAEIPNLDGGTAASPITVENFAINPHADSLQNHIAAVGYFAGTVKFGGSTLPLTSISRTILTATFYDNEAYFLRLAP